VNHDAVHHPKHYTSHPSGLECIQITERMGFCAGNAIKYLWRSELKGKRAQDTQKAMWYIDRILSEDNPGIHYAGRGDGLLSHYEQRVAAAGGWNAPMICNIIHGVVNCSLPHIAAARDQLEYFINHPREKRHGAHSQLPT
jgi:hypothetical protein